MPRVIVPTWLLLRLLLAAMRILMNPGLLSPLPHSHFPLRSAAAAAAGLAPVVAASFTQRSACACAQATPHTLLSLLLYQGPPLLLFLHCHHCYCRLCHQPSLALLLLLLLPLLLLLLPPLYACTKQLRPPLLLLWVRWEAKYQQLQPFKQLRGHALPSSPGA